MDARQALERGELSRHDYKRVEDRAVDDAIALQRDCGLDVLSDGETRRLVFTGSLIDAVEGIDGPPPPPTTWRGDEAYGTEDLTRTVAQHSVSAKLRRVRSVATEEFTYLRARTDQPAKATLPSPLMLGKWWDPESSTEAYADPFDAFADAADILKEEIRELARLGCTYVQIDATDIATLADPAVCAQYDRLGIGAARMLGEGIELLDSITDVAAAGGELIFAIHLCKGNSESRYLAAGAYDAIADAVFPRLKGYDVLLLEYDDERSGGFEPIAKTLDHQVVALGLVSSKNPDRGVRRPGRRPDQAGRPFRSGSSASRSPANAASPPPRAATGSRPRSSARSSSSSAARPSACGDSSQPQGVRRHESQTSRHRHRPRWAQRGGERRRESPRPRLRQHPGFSQALVWTTAPGPTLPFDGADPTPVAPSLVPVPGATSFIVLMFPPDAVYADSGFDGAAAAAEAAEHSPGIAETLEPDSPGMHTTPTVDYNVVLDGEIWLELSDGAEVKLAAGDVVVQHGARHAWRNKSGRPATIAAILIGAQRVD